MVYEFRLPDIGEGIAEGEVVRWLVREGEEVKENQPLVEIMTDKVNVEIPSPKQGKVLRLMAKEGEIVKVGQVLISIDERDARLSTPGPQAPSTSQVAVSKITAAPITPVVAPVPRHLEILATPATRKLARELGVDLTVVPGSGAAGRITDDDVRRFKELQGKAVAIPVSVPSVHSSEERVPLRGLRRKIAERMVKSIHSAAQVTHVDEVDMTEVVELREKAKQLTEKRGGKITYLPFIIKALIPALKQYPYLNASLDDEKEEIILKHYYNIGIATETEQGLVVPVIRDAEHKSIVELADEIERLSGKARAGQLALDEVQRSTFTVTNVGGIGGVFATPIINYPEVAILGIYKIRKTPVVMHDQIIIRDMSYLSVSFDHRVLDGAMAAEFMNAVKRYVEDPKLLVLEYV